MKSFWVGVLLAVFASSASADVQRIEAVGTYGIRESSRNRVIARDEAIAQGIWEGVGRVALELLGESGIDRSGAGEGSNRPSPSEDESAMLESALGKDLLPYTRSFRILKDRGEKPVLFAENPAIKTEYVVVVEVLVDVDRVEGALEKAGLLSSDSLTPSSSGEAVILEIVGLARHAGLTAAIDVLTNQLGATRVDPIEFRREVQVLSVRGPFGVEGLADRLGRNRNGALIFDAIDVDQGAGRIRTRGRWTPPQSVEN